MSEPIRRFDRANVTLLSDLLLSMFQVVAKQYGLTITRENGRYQSDSYTCSFTFKIPSADGAPAGFRQAMAKYDLPEDCWGKRFHYDSFLYEVYDVRPRNRKYPILVKRVHDGKIYKFPAGTVRRGLQDFR